ncbi:MAG: carbohydrate-binding protein [Bacteroidales bacterium]|nr:carbohydrate-binding protein [Bacteroidales bacterium]
MQTLRVYASGANWNINWMNFVSGTATITNSINATAGPNGSISPSGNVTVVEGGDQTFNISANSGYEIEDVLVNGSSIGSVSAYTFNNVTSNNTISATFGEVTTTPTKSIPGKIEAEDYDAMSGVQTENTSDAGGGLNVGWINAGDWMDYQVYVSAAGTYTVEYRVASTKSTGQLQLQLDGTVLSEMAIPNTGNWQSWTTITNEVTLPAGTQTLRLYASGSDWNINWMNFVSDTQQNLTNVTVAYYTFSSSSLTSSDTDENTTAGSFNNGPGISGGTSFWDGGRSVNQTVLTQLISNAIASEDYFEFTVTPASGVSLDLTTLTFNAKRGGSSPDRIRPIAAPTTIRPIKRCTLPQASLHSPGTSLSLGSFQEP